MEDHHVDRPGVEAQQCVKLTGTNSSIGLIVLIFAARVLRKEQTRSTERPAYSSSVLRRPGGYCEEPEPDPIPNSAVKLLRANDTSSQDVGK